MAFCTICLLPVVNAHDCKENSPSKWTNKEAFQKLKILTLRLLEDYDKDTIKRVLSQLSYPKDK